MKFRHIFILSVFTVFACNKNKSSETEVITNTVSTDTLLFEKPVEEVDFGKEYKNERFRKVTLEKLGKNKFRVKGQAQVFEATINWSVEDGHYVIIDGFTTASIGSPEWGDFDFTFEAKKGEQNSALTLILFEESAKDGSQQNRLPISLN